MINNCRDFNEVDWGSAVNSDIVGSLGNIGTKGKLLVLKEWWEKFIFGLEFTQPFKIVIDYIRKNI